MEVHFRKGLQFVFFQETASESPRTAMLFHLLSVSQYLALYVNDVILSGSAQKGSCKETEPKQKVKDNQG